MGILSTASRLFSYDGQYAPAQTGLASDWSASELATIHGPAAELITAVSEGDAVKVPPVSRALALYMTAALKCSLVTRDGSALPAWLAAAEGAMSPGMRLAQTVKDLIFHGRSCWWTPRSGGTITGALRLPLEAYGLDWLGRVTVSGVPVEDQSQFLVFPALRPGGFLSYGADAIAHYIGIRDAILERSRNPIPVVELKVKDAAELEPDELKQAQANWAAARAARNGAVAVTPLGVDVIIHGDKADTSMLSEARNALRLDVANFLNINASLLEGANGTSDTYSNTLDSRNEFAELSLDEWLEPIAQRLSQPDAVPAGVRFDTSRLVPAPANGNSGEAVRTVQA